MTNFKKTPLHRVFECVRSEAERHGVADRRVRDRGPDAGRGALRGGGALPPAGGVFRGAGAGDEAAGGVRRGRGRGSGLAAAARTPRNRRSASASSADSTAGFERARRGGRGRTRCGARGPALRAWMRPWSGRPSSARSPMRSRTLWRTNSSRNRSGPERMPVSSRTTALCRLPPRARPAGPQLRDLAREAERPRRRDARGELLGPEREGQLLAADDRMREVDLVGDGQAGAVRLVEHAAVVADDLDRLGRARSGRTRASCRSKPAAWKRRTKGRAEPSRIGTSGPSISIRQLSRPTPGRRREHVLDRADRDVAALEGGRVVEGGGRFEPRPGRLVRVVPPQEDEAVVDRRRVEMGPSRVAGMEADAVDRDGRSAVLLAVSCLLLRSSIASQ